MPCYTLMMNRFFKTAMLWLLALALPVQGFAAVTQSSCAPQMQHVIAVAEAVENSAHSHHSISVDNVEYTHHQMTVQVNDANTLADQQTDQTQSHASVKCSACAVCCIGIAMLPGILELPVFPLVSSPVVSSPSSSFFGFIPDGIKRPPKPSLV